MATLRERVEARDRASFVGRTEELALFERILGDERPTSIVHVVGPGGIGKSALVRAVARRAAALGIDVRWLEGRDLPPFPDALETAFAGIDGTRRTLVVIDTFDLVGALEAHLRSVVIPSLPASTIVVIVGRQRPSPAWFDGGWDAATDVVELGGLGDDDARQLVRHHGVDDEAAIGALLRRSGGSPLALVVGAHAGGPGSLAELVDRLLGSEADADRTRTLTVAAIARVTTPELLDAVLPDEDAAANYKWLADRSFAEPLADGLTLHALVARSVREAVRARDPAGEAALRRRTADHLYRQGVAGRFSLSTDLQHLVVDQTVRWGYALDVGNRFRIDNVRPGDAERVGAILHAVGLDDWWRETEVFFREHPAVTSVARSASGAVGGYSIAVTPADAPAAAERDVLLGPWLRHARDVLRTTSAVLWREAVDLTGTASGEVTSLLGTAGIIGSGVANPRYGYLPISPVLPAARAFSEALGATHLPELDVDVLGMQLECHLVDFGPRGVLGFQRDWIYRETGVAPPGDDEHDDPVRLLKLLRDPTGLAEGPAWLGERPSERLEALRSLVRDALVVFGPSTDDRLACDIIVAAYLGEGESHEAIARRFHLSRSAYFRRLHAATRRVSEELGARLRRRDPLR